MTQTETEIKELKVAVLAIAQALEKQNILVGLYGHLVDQWELELAEPGEED